MEFSTKVGVVALIAALLLGIVGGGGVYTTKTNSYTSTTATVLTDPRAVPDAPGSSTFTDKADIRIGDVEYRSVPAAQTWRAGDRVEVFVSDDDVSGVRYATPWLNIVSISVIAGIFAGLVTKFLVMAYQDMTVSKASKREKIATTATKATYGTW